MKQESEQIKKAIKEVIEENKAKQKRILLNIIIMFDVMIIGMVFGIGSYISLLSFLRLGKDQAMAISFGMSAVIGMFITALVLWKKKK